MYITHFYCLAVEAGFYSDVVECLPVDPVAQVRFPPRAARIFLHPVTSSPNCMMSSSVTMEILCITNIGSISSKKIVGVEKLL